MMSKNSLVKWAAALLAAVWGSLAWADVIQTQDFAITQTGDALENTPVVGHDVLGELVTYSNRSVAAGTAGRLIFYERADKTGAPTGIAIQISTGMTYDPLNCWSRPQCQPGRRSQDPVRMHIKEKQRCSDN